MRVQRVGKYDCEDCGITVIRRKRADRPRVCLEHGIARAVANAVELARAADARVGGPSRMTLWRRRRVA